MHWLIKAATQKAISYFPHSEKINYLFRRNIARSLPANKDTFFRMIDIGMRHYNNYRKYGLLNELSKAKFYEFGACGDLIIPLLPENIKRMLQNSQAKWDIKLTL